MFDESTITGLDPGLAKKNIAKFAEAVNNATCKIQGSMVYLFDQLSYVWASERAVEFYNTYNTRVDDLVYNLSQYGYDICQNAIRAYNIMANANGAGTIEKYCPVTIMYSASIPKLYDNKDGKKGMNVNLVKNFLLPEFSKMIADVVDAIDFIPVSIALYDSENSQSGAFNTGVSFMLGKYNDLVMEIESDLNSAITKEIDTIQLAKQQSTDAMNNMNA